MQFRFLLLLLSLAGIFSFTAPTGGDRFEVYLNKKLLFQQYVGQQSYQVKSFQLDRHNYNATIDIVYSHCGQAGKKRVIKITDESNHLLKEWNFPDAEDDKAIMTCEVKELLQAEDKNEGHTLNIYYSSAQLPQGRLLASVVLVDHSTAP